jgi:hypothetical protein
MSQLMTFFIRFWEYLPWVAVGLMAAMALRKRHDSKALMLQACGASAMFLLGMGHWLGVEVILRAMNTPKLAYAADNVFEFLFFLALLAFAAGYCGERFARRKPAEVTATPVD